LKQRPDSLSSPLSLSRSGDRFIEEKTLLLAVRSYVFFSQLSAWLSASHGIVPRNILYRISAADEECVCQFSQPPAEHLFPVPNVSQSVALRLRVQSLPRQPTYPTLACSIHTGLTLAPLYSKTPSLKPNLSPNLYSKTPSLNPGLNPNQPLGSAFLWPPLPQSSQKLSSTLPLPPGGKTVRWLYSLTSDPSDDITHTTEDYGKAVNGAESSKGRGSEAPRAFKTYSLAEPPRCPSPRPSSETNPLIGSLLQERQEVIARIAQRLNFCDPTAPHLPPALFTPDTPTKTPVRSSYLGNTTLSKTKEPEGAPPTEDTPPSPFDTPIAAIIRETLSPKPVACRRLRLPEDRDGERHRRERDNCLSPLCPQHTAAAAARYTNHIHTAHTRCALTHTPHTEATVIAVATATATRPAMTHTLPHTHLLAQTELVLLQRQTSLHPNRPQEEPRPSSPKDNILRTIQTLTVTQTTTLTQTTAQTLTTKFTHTQTTALIQNHMKPLTQSHNQTQTVSRTPPSRTQGSPRTQSSSLQDENQPPPRFQVLQPPRLLGHMSLVHLNTRSPSPLRPCNSWKKHNRHSLDSTLTKAFHPCTGLPLLSSPVPQRRTQTGYFDLDSSLTSCKGLPWTAGKRVCVKRVEESEEPQPLFSASAPPASLSLLGNFEECVLNYRLEPLGSVEGFMAEVGASGTFCPSHMTFPVDVSFYSISDDNAPSPYMVRHTYSTYTYILYISPTHFICTEQKYKCNHFKDFTELQFI
ncbi:unnamed protein product, partial [Oncorhynchus mykiss]